MTVKSEDWMVIGLLLLISWLAPNTQELTGYVGPTGIYGEGMAPETSIRLRWQPTLRWAVLTGSVFAVAIMSLSRISEFIYFQF